MKKQVDPTRFITTNHVRCSTKYPGAPSNDTLRASFFAEAIQNFRLPRKYLPPRPLTLTKRHISPVSAFLSKLKPSLLASSAASSLATLLHAARPRLSRQVIHTRPHPPPPSTSHMPRPPARVRHLPPKPPTPPPNKRRPKPWCTQYSQDLKEHLEVEKQIVAACVD